MFEARVLKINANEENKSNFTKLWEKAVNVNQTVLRIYERVGNKFRFALDFRSGLITGERLTERELRAFVLSALPFPEEELS